MLDLEETRNLVDLPSRGATGLSYRPVPVCPPLAVAAEPHSQQDSDDTEPNKGNCIASVFLILAR